MKENDCTCTIYRHWDRWLWTFKLVDIVISRTSFDLDGVGCVGTALIINRAVDFTSNNSIFWLRMRATKPQRTKTSTWHVTETPLGHLRTRSINEESIPAIPFNTSVIVSRHISILIPVIECASPVIIKNVVIVAWVIICVNGSWWDQNKEVIISVHVLTLVGCCRVCSVTNSKESDATYK